MDNARRSAVIDFTGTREQQPSNFNAPRSITMAAMLYGFRTPVDDAIPLNAGCLKPIEVIVPEGSLLDPRQTGAFGGAGGRAGKPGANWVERADGQVEQLSHIGEVNVLPDDVFVIRTPGGGWEPPAAAQASRSPKELASS